MHVIVKARPAISVRVDRDQTQSYTEVSAEF